MVQRRVAIVTALIAMSNLVILPAFRIPGAIAAESSGEQSADSSHKLADVVFEKCKKLIGEYYSKVKVHREGNKITFEYKTRLMEGAPRDTKGLAPDLGGVLCEVELLPGQYKGRVRLPQQYNEYGFYSVILMAPYSQAHNCHLYARLYYPPDTEQVFLDEFRDLVNNFEKLLPSKAGASEKSNITDDSAQSSSSTLSSDAAATDSGAQHAGDNSDPGGRGSLSEASGAAESSSSSSKAVKLFLWRAEKDGKMFYLMGTLPYVSDDAASRGKERTLSPQVDTALQLTKQVIVGDTDVQAELLGDKSYFSANDKLSSHMSSPTREALDKYFAWSGDNLDMYEFFKPWFVTTIFERSLARLDGFKICNDREQVLQKSKKQGKSVIELESKDARLLRLDSTQSDIQDRTLRLAALNLINFQKDQGDMSLAFQTGDGNKLWEAYSSTARKDKELSDFLNQQVRSKNSAVFEKLMSQPDDKTPVFVLVDAWQIPGEEGLLAMFDKKGFRTQQVEDDVGALVVQPATTVKAEPAAAQSEPIAKEEPQATKTASLDPRRLSKFSYPEGKFSISLPDRPAVTYTNEGGQRRVNYVYSGSEGTMTVGYIIFPDAIAGSAVPGVLTKVSGGFARLFDAKSVKQFSVMLKNFPGRLMEFHGVKGNDGRDARLKLFVAGNYIYIVGAEGNADWIHSPTVGEFLNSLSINQDFL
ncbi:MAG: TraB/GumN family protein [Cyanobacteria bacterium]|nr:TraB/GumN family protein [Cyanobacteriota bacterium]